MPVFLPQIHALEKALPVHNKRDGVVGKAIDASERKKISAFLRRIFVSIPQYFKHMIYYSQTYGERIRYEFWKTW